MPKGIMYVESRPKSPEDEAAYHEWYNERHLSEISAIDGVVAARRYAPLDNTGSYIAIYELDADDLDAVRSRLTESLRSGEMSPPVGVQTSPPPTTLYYREIASHVP